MDTVIPMVLDAQWADQGPATFDDLIVALKQLAMHQSLPAMLAALLRRQEERLLDLWAAGTLTPPSCCAHAAYSRHGRLPRRLRTSLGVVDFDWQRLQCRHCHQSWTPLRDWLRLRPKQAKTDELQQQVIQACDQQSFRRVSGELAAHQLQVPKSTLHYWVKTSQAAPLPPGPTRVPTLLADATLYAQHPRAATGIRRHGELRVVYALTSTNTLHPIGVWGDDSWHDIGHQIAARGLHALALVCDGEPGLAEGLAPTVNAVQRCHWHLVHALDPVLLADKVAKAERRQWQKRLGHLLGLDLPPGTPATCLPSTLARFRRALNEANAGIEALLAEAQGHGYAHTVSYLTTALPHLFTYAQAWLRYGVRVPRVTTRLEAVMRLIKRRLRRLANNWAPAGARQMAQFILKQIHCAHAWWNHWHPTGAHDQLIRLNFRIGVA